MGDINIYDICDKDNNKADKDIRNLLVFAWSIMSVGGLLPPSQYGLHSSSSYSK